MGSNPCFPEASLHLVSPTNAQLPNNKMSADKTIKYDPVKSVLKYRAGDEIKLSEADFVRLSSAFLAEIESKYL